MTGLCFVDANVFVYARDPRESVKQPRAAEWIERLWRERRARTSIQAISEYYAILTRKLGCDPELAASYAGRFLEWNPQPVDGRLLRDAWEVQSRYRISWWDSLIVAAAQLQECDTLLTEDLHDGMTFGSMRVRNPFQHAVESLEAAYRLEPVAASLHRPRGRPRRALATRP
jgi:predicted nucleic acid-binding protein